MVQFRERNSLEAIADMTGADIDYMRKALDPILSRVKVYVTIREECREGCHACLIVACIVHCEVADLKSMRQHNIRQCAMTYFACDT
jgi:hypothetical protein